MLISVVDQKSTSMLGQELGKENASSTSIKCDHQGDTVSISSNKSSPTPAIDHQPKSPKPNNRFFSLLQLIASQWFIISLGLVILIASQVQVHKAHQSLKSTVVSYLCVSLIFFLTGCTLSTRTLIDNSTRWKLHLFIQVQVYLAVSTIFFAVVSLCALDRDFMDPGLLLGLILTGCTPTTIASNVIMTKQAHGNQALTVVESTLSNFLGPFLTPVLFRMFVSGRPWYAAVLPPDDGGYGEIYRRVFRQLGLSLFVPMLAGQLVQHVFPAFTKRVIVGWKLTKLSSLCLLVIVWQTYDSAFSSGAFTTIKASNMIFIVFGGIGLYILLIALSLVTSVWWLPKEDTVAVAYILPAKTPAMGVPLAMTMFVGLTPVLQAKLQIPMVVYQGLQIVGGTLCITPLKRWVDRSKAREVEDASQSATKDVDTPI